MQAALAKHGDVSKARGCQVDTSLNQFDGYSDHQRRDHLGRCVCPSSQGRYTSCAWPRGPRWSWRSSRRSWRQSRVERQGAKGRHSRDQGGRRQARRRTVEKQMQRPNDSFGFLLFFSRPCTTSTSRASPSVSLFTSNGLVYGMLIRGVELFFSVT
jgi:hypothetical protein